MEILKSNRFSVEQGVYEGDDLHHRPFTYFTQNLRGTSDHWLNMVNNLASDSKAEIMGLIIPTKKLVWSTNAPAHMMLEKAVGSGDWNAKIESHSGGHISKPDLVIYTNSLILPVLFKNYLLRSGISSELIEVYVATYRGQKHQLI